LTDRHSQCDFDFDFDFDFGRGNVVRITKSRKTKFAGNVARTGEKRVVYTVLWLENLKERGHFGLNRRIILINLIIKK
jgi:hypothetical protein